MPHYEQLCPVCNGGATVPAGFYAGFGVSTNAMREQCRRCQGLGTIHPAGRHLYTPGEIAAALNAAARANTGGPVKVAARDFIIPFLISLRATHPELAPLLDATREVPN